MLVKVLTVGLRLIHCQVKIILLVDGGVVNILLVNGGVGFFPGGPVFARLCLMISLMKVKYS